MICNWSNHFEKKKNHKNQGELDTAGTLDLNNAIQEPDRETLIARRRQAAYPEVVYELEDDTDVSDSNVE